MSLNLIFIQIRPVTWPFKFAAWFFLHVKSFELAFAKMPIFILFILFFILKRKKMNLENNPEMSYDSCIHIFFYLS